MFVHVGTNPKILLVVAVLCAALATWHVWRGWSARRCVTVDAVVLENGGASDGLWVSVTGRPLWDCLVSEGGSDAHRRFVPIVSDKWSSGNDAGIFLELIDRDRDLEPPHSEDVQTFKGTVPLLRGLGGAARSALQAKGVGVAASPMLIDPGHDYHGYFTEAEVCGGMALGMVALYFPLRWLARRSKQTS